MAFIKMDMLIKLTTPTLKTETKRQSTKQQTWTFPGAGISSDYNQMSCEDKAIAICWFFKPRLNTQWTLQQNFFFSLFLEKKLSGFCYFEMWYWSQFFLHIFVIFKYIYIHLFLSNVLLFYYLLQETFHYCTVHWTLWEIKDLKQIIFIIIITINHTIPFLLNFFKQLNYKNRASTVTDFSLQSDLWFSPLIDNACNASTAGW